MVENGCFCQIRLCVCNSLQKPQFHVSVHQPCFFSVIKIYNPPCVNSSPFYSFFANKLFLFHIGTGNKLDGIAQPLPQMKKSNNWFSLAKFCSP